jgi:hypothetical protein
MAEEEMAAWSGGETAPRREAAHEAGDDAGIRALAAELLAALRDAAIARLEAHKQLAAEQTADIGDAVQRFGRSVDQTEGKVVNRYCDRAAAWIMQLSQTMRERRLGQIAADAEDFARRRPVWFMLAALGAGFAAGRLLMAAAERERRQAPASPPFGGAPPVAGQPASRIEELL